VAVVPLFSKRKKLQGSKGKPDVYQYDEIPQPLRVQIAHIWGAAIGPWRSDGGFFSEVSASPSCGIWRSIHEMIAREKGVWALGDLKDRQLNPRVRCVQHLMSADTDDALDIIELSFRCIDGIARDFDQFVQHTAEITQSPDDAIDELNTRFRERGVGYQYVDGYLLRVDSQLLHAEAVKLALSLLHDSRFSGPADEFMRALDHHRKGESKDAIADALNAFESTMKAICTARKWTYGPKDTAAPLLNILMKNGLVPPELEAHFGGLRSAMESGLPTLANRTSRHGQGATRIEVPPHYAAYALHLVASNIVFLLGCHKAKK
jgi:hypothetical protein